MGEDLFGGKTMMRSLLASALSLACVSAFAQMSPVGVWQTINDETGKPQSEVTLVDAGGVITGTVTKSLVPPSNEPNCVKCTDERKDKPKLGMEIIRGAKKSETQAVWEGGNILDPNNGTIYKLKMTPIDGGSKLEVRGFIGIALLGRTQTWVRIP
jgi:uncharacterized protein (DUF2147 family)